MVGKILRMLNSYSKTHTLNGVGKIALKIWRTIYNNNRSWRYCQHTIFDLSLWRRWFYSNSSKSSYFRTNLLENMNNSNKDDLDMTKDECTSRYNIWKRPLNIFGTDLVGNIWTIYVNTKHITEQNTIRSTNSS